VHQAEPTAAAERPLEVVQQAPGEVALEWQSLLDGLVAGVDVQLDEVPSLLVVDETVRPDLMPCSRQVSASRR
jgi:hypothetical protein